MVVVVVVQEQWLWWLSQQRVVQCKGSGGGCTGCGGDGEAYSGDCMDGVGGDGESGEAYSDDCMDGVGDGESGDIRGCNVIKAANTSGPTFTACNKSFLLSLNFLLANLFPSFGFDLCAAFLSVAILFLTCSYLYFFYYFHPFILLAKSESITQIYDQAIVRIVSEIVG